MIDTNNLSLIYSFFISIKEENRIYNDIDDWKRTFKR